MRMKRILKGFAWTPIRLEGGGMAFMCPVWNAVLVDADPERPSDEIGESVGFYRTSGEAEARLRAGFPDVPFVWEPQS